MHLLQFGICSALLLGGCRTEPGESTNPLSLPDVKPHAWASDIPPVEGIRAEVDTLAGAVTLSWPPAGFPALSEYAVYRLEDGPDAPAFAPEIGHTSDTVFLDKVLKDLGQREVHAQYRVRIRDKAGRVGLSPRPLVVHVPPESLVITAAGLTVLGATGDVLGLGDTARYIVDFRNPTRRISRIRWTVAGLPGLDRTVAPDTTAGRDTLKVVENGATEVSIEVDVQDEAGDRIRLTRGLSVLPVHFRIARTEDPSFFNPGPFPSFPAGDRIFHYGGSGYGPRIFDRRNGAWTDGPRIPGQDKGYGILVSGDTVYALGEKLYRFDFTERAWKTLRPPPMVGPGAALNGKLYLIPAQQEVRDSSSLWAYDPAMDDWTANAVIPPHPRRESYPAGFLVYLNLIPYQGRLYALRDGWTDRSTYAKLPDPGMSILDPVSGACDSGGLFPLLTLAHGMGYNPPPTIRHVMNGGSRLRVLNRYNQVNFYDSGRRIWLSENPAPLQRPTNPAAVVSRGDTLITFFPAENGRPQEVYAMDLETGASTPLLGSRPELGPRAALTWLGSSLFLHGTGPLFFEIGTSP